MNDLQELRKKISKHKNTSKQHPRSKRSSNFSALNISCEIVGSIAFGFIIGHALDKYFETKFIFSFILLILALASSFYTIYKKIK